MADVAFVVEARFGVVVTYEDPLYGPSEVVRDADGRLVPAGGRVVVDYDDGHPAGAVLARAIEAHEAAKSPGVFALDSTGGVLHVAPPRSILEARVHLPAKSRTGLDFLDEVAQAVQREAGAAVSLGTVPTNALAGSSTRRGATGERARDVVLGLFGEMGWSWSWQLLNAAGQDLFVLNLHPLAT